MRDFISSWWTPLNEHKDPTFERVARERLNVVCLNLQKILLKQERNDIVMSTLYGVANTLIIHMRECRAFEDSKLTMDEYVLDNPQSPFAQLLSKEEQHRQLRGISHTFLKRTLPAPDRDSHLMMSLFKELLTTFVFGSVLDSLSDPDFLNCWIVDFLSDKETVAAIASTVSDTVLKKETTHNSMPRLSLESIQDEDQTDNSSIIQKPTISDEEISKSLSNHHVTPPDTPQLDKKPSPIITTASPRSSNETTLLASLQSPPPLQQSSPLEPPAMIFNPGSVSFTIMDISAPQPLIKSDLVYIIQIERPAMEEHSASEGGGYVITRTYADFESLHVILYAKHVKRASQLQLKLPLDDTTTSSKLWLKKSSSIQLPKKKALLLETMGEELKRYIDIVVQDDEIGTDSIILAFLRKETRSDAVMDNGMVVSFSDEFKDEVTMAYNVLINNATQHGKSRSLFSRNSSSNTLNNMANNSVESFHSKADGVVPAFGSERMSMDQESINSGKLFASKSKTRKDSISSVQSNLSRDNYSIATKEENDGQQEDSTSSTHYTEYTITKSRDNSNNKTLSSMDVELLIETTYALIIEIFNLTSSNNKAWMRRSILNLLREIVRRSYSEFIAEQYTDFVNEYMSPDAIVSVLNQLGEKFWPEGKWVLDGKEQAKRTDEDKEKSKQQAREMLMTQLIPNAVRQLIGDQNCNKAMDRIWVRCQDPALNRVLILQLLERIIKPILG
ncbi:MAG: PXA domain-containing protein [Benjaminiella poitrasii]|nr:MAG: PXA domain-containing protein [Benjaminiella poitrasii]